MGQICTATSRVLVQEGVYDKFVELFKDVVKSTSKIADPFSEECFQGPQVLRRNMSGCSGISSLGNPMERI